MYHRVWDSIYAQHNCIHRKRSLVVTCTLPEFDVDFNHQTSKVFNNSKLIFLCIVDTNTLKLKKNHLYCMHVCTVYLIPKWCIPSLGINGTVFLYFSIYSKNRLNDSWTRVIQYVVCITSFNRNKHGPYAPHSFELKPFK